MELNKTLITLQNLSSQLIVLQKRALEISDSSEIAHKKNELDTLKKQYQQLVNMRKDAETEVQKFQKLTEDATQDKKKTEHIIENSSDFRRMDTFQKQLSDIEKRIEKNTFKKTEATTRLTKVLAAEKNAQKKCTELTASLQNLVSCQKASLEKMAKEAKDVRSEHDKLVRELPESARETYLEAQKRFQGHGVEELHGAKPTFCRVQLQPAQLSDLENATAEIPRCPYCSRILVRAGSDA